MLGRSSSVKNNQKAHSRDSSGASSQSAIEALEAIKAQDEKNHVPGDAGAPRPDAKEKEKERDKVGAPNFSAIILTNNFRKFSQRIDPIFNTQDRIKKILEWEDTRETLSCLIMYSLLCLNPHLIPAIPLCVVLFGLLIPAYTQHHRVLPTEAGTIQPAPRPNKELSRDFLLNMRDIQNSMDDYTTLYDTLTTHITAFTAERVAGELVFLLTLGLFALVFCGKYVPWRFVFLGAGWIVVMSKHPDNILPPPAEQGMDLEEKILRHRYIELDVIEPNPVLKTVEVYELQRAPSESSSNFFTGSGELKSTFLPNLDSGPGQGTGRLENIEPPPGWTWGDAGGGWKVEKMGYVRDKEGWVEEEGKRWRKLTRIVMKV
ncbi:hypothetical protein SAICODRAFT_35478 [Saitoella complicata NRRL Y-17804]|uniref:uncharacterized protein n=1 Tax=Saitoella complicata (strain BCRC 22490 / CBS 7301 / JCM 7358 / NBRC 10748 / NRRL Y-17804) TaxID=698492 RepID=UPI000866B567|nr:uncharacterized protein SAICODRAFT_35478 [Saitoella complicata NRRL Y-17804]ODQ52827.1 hypothetical protein SAICODRAFT_35478 [Saitoella complicata NRRL Y-17804]